MADADDTQRLAPVTAVECARCGWLRDRKGEEIREHHQSCPFRDSEADSPSDESKA